jgi:hypothetical protein
MNSGIEGNSYGAVISPSRITYKVGQGASQVMRDAVLIGTNDDEVNYGSTQFATDLILQMPMMYNNGVYVGSGALSTNIPDGTAKGGNVRGTGAIDLQTYRTSANQVASGPYSIVTGYNSISSGSASISMGYANTSSSYSSVAIGYNNTASSTASISLGYANTSSNFASVAMGNNNIASGGSSIAMGYSNVASGTASIAMGFRSHTNGISGRAVIGTPFSGINGAYQLGQLGLGAITTDATATILKSDTNAVSATNQCTLQNNNAVSFDIEIVAINTGTGKAGQWNTTGLIKRGANASSTTLVGTPTINLTFGDSESWITASAVSISADTTNGALSVSVTGAASTTIHWMCRINTVEVI